MHKVILITLLASIAHAHGIEPPVDDVNDPQSFVDTSANDLVDELADELVDELADQLVQRGLSDSSLENANLDRTTLGKPGNLGIPFQASEEQSEDRYASADDDDQEETLGWALGLRGGADAATKAKPEAKPKAAKPAKAKDTKTAAKPKVFKMTKARKSKLSSLEGILGMLGALAAKADGVKAMAATASHKTQNAIRRTKGMPALKLAKPKKVSIIAKGKLSKALVFRGSKEKTASGLSAGDLIKNKYGRIVSKKRSALGKASNRLKGWTDAVSQARKALGVKGFTAIKKGTPLYNKAKDIYKSVKGKASAPAKR